MLEAILAAAICGPCLADPAQQLWDEQTGAMRAAYCGHRAVAVFIGSNCLWGIMVFQQIPAESWRLIAGSLDGAMKAMFPGQD